MTGVEFNPASFSSEKAVDAETQVGGMMVALGVHEASSVLSLRLRTTRGLHSFPPRCAIHNTYVSFSPTINMCKADGDETLCAFPSGWSYAVNANSGEPFFIVYSGYLRTSVAYA